MSIIVASYVIVVTVTVAHVHDVIMMYIAAA